MAACSFWYVADTKVSEQATVAIFYPTNCLPIFILRCALYLQIYLLYHAVSLTSAIFSSRLLIFLGSPPYTFFCLFHACSHATNLTSLIQVNSRFRMCILFHASHISLDLYSTAGMVGTFKLSATNVRNLK